MTITLSAFEERLPAETNQLLNDESGENDGGITRLHGFDQEAVLIQVRRRIGDSGAEGGKSGDEVEVEAARSPGAESCK